MSAQHRWQFSLRWILLVTVVASVVFAIAGQFPEKSAFAATMSVLMIVPLISAAAIRDVLTFLLAGRRSLPNEIAMQDRPTEPSQILPVWRFFRWLGLWPIDHRSGIKHSLVIAAASSLVTIGGWPIIRRIGFCGALASERPLRDTWHEIAQYSARSISLEFWLDLWAWEAWAMGRWWLLFGALTLAWLPAVALFAGRDKATSVVQTVSRFLAFAPWLIVLEIAFLIGVWAQSPSTVPEPSTGFVVGIFDWSLWHWDCCWDREWLQRSALATWVAGFAFFRGVLRWHGFVAVLAAVALIPVAILVSIANTVAFQHGFPSLFG